MGMDAEFREFLKRHDSDRVKADEDRRKADERFEAMMRRLEQNDRRIEKLMERSDRRERELAKGLAMIGKRILETQEAILAVLRINGRSGGAAAQN
jgi:hypothetical protein